MTFYKDNEFFLFFTILLTTNTGVKSGVAIECVTNRDGWIIKKEQIMKKKKIQCKNINSQT